MGSFDMFDLLNFLHPNSQLEFHFCGFFKKIFPKLSFCYLTVNKNFFLLNSNLSRSIPLPENMRNSINKRKIEFLLGRYCAQKSLFNLGIQVGFLDRNENRVPIWPNGYTGSISHSNEHFIAVSSSTTNYSGLGVDIEKFISQKYFLSISNFILNYDEKNLMKEIDSNKKMLFLTLFFSAKESFYKLFFQQTSIKLDFTAISIIKFDYNHYIIRLNKTINNKYKRGTVLKGFYIIVKSMVITLMLEPYNSSKLEVY